MDVSVDRHLATLRVGSSIPRVAAYAIDFDLECPENKVVIIRTTNPDPICVYATTAQHWVGMDFDFRHFYLKSIEIHSYHPYRNLPKETILHL